MLLSLLIENHHSILSAVTTIIYIVRRFYHESNTKQEPKQKKTHIGCKKKVKNKSQWKKQNRDYEKRRETERERLKR